MLHCRLENVRQHLLQLAEESFCQFSSAPETIESECTFFAMSLCRLKSVRQRLLELAEKSQVLLNYRAVFLELSLWSFPNMF